MGTLEAARRLGTSPPTVRSLIASQLLTATQERRGSRFAWRIDATSVERYLADHGSFARRRRSGTTRLERLETELSSLRELLDASRSADTPALTNVREIERERDDLRARVVTLEDALARSRTVAELQRKADAERASVIEHLTAAAAASERADGLRRQALHELEEALAAASGPRHPGELS